MLVALVVYKAFKRVTRGFELSSKYAPLWLSNLAGILAGALTNMMGVTRGEPDEILFPLEKGRQYMVSGSHAPNPAPPTPDLIIRPAHPQVSWHPHGAYAFIAATKAGHGASSGWWPFRYHALIADVLFEVPFAREMLMIFGAKRVNKRSIRLLLNNGDNIALQPGGIHEQIRTRHDQEVAYFPPNLGFVRQAIEHGVPLLPCYLFGENQIFTVSDAARALARFTHETFGMPLLAVTNRYGIPLVPNPTTIYIKSGRPVEVGPPTANPSEERVRAVFDEYVKSLLELFNMCKDKCLPPEVAKRGLKIVLRPKRKRRADVSTGTSAPATSKL